jgi:hypothetical protein
MCAKASMCVERVVDVDQQDIGQRLERVGGRRRRSSGGPHRTGRAIF